jgi:hypothetical protein
LTEHLEAIDVLHSLRQNCLPVSDIILYGSEHAPNQWLEVVVLSLCEAALN